MGAAFELGRFYRQHPLVVSVTAAVLVLLVLPAALIWIGAPDESLEARAERVRNRVRQQPDATAAPAQAPPQVSAPGTAMPSTEVTVQARPAPARDDFTYPARPALPVSEDEIGALKTLLQTYVNDSEGVIESAELDMKGRALGAGVTVWLNAAANTQVTREMAPWQAGACVEKVVKFLVARKVLRSGTGAATGPSVCVYVRIPARSGLTGEKRWYIPICARYDYQTDAVAWEELPLEKYRKWIE